MVGEKQQSLIQVDTRHTLKHGKLNSPVTTHSLFLAGMSVYDLLVLKSARTHWWYVMRKDRPLEATLNYCQQGQEQNYETYETV